MDTAGISIHTVKYSVSLKFHIFDIIHTFLSGHDFQNKTPAANSGSTAKHSRKC